MSAMLGYLVDSNKDHGLGDTLTRAFLKLLDGERFSNILAFPFINAQVSLEEPYQLNGSRRDIDIQIIILDEQKREIHRLIIENKIKSGAANPKQLKEYYSAVLEEEPDIQNLSIVFLTPRLNSILLDAEFNNLVLAHDDHRKYWIHWSSEDRCVAWIIKALLMQEIAGEINPINDYMRHTLKAFIRHSKLTTEPETQKAMRTGEDIGEIIDEAVIELSSGRYKVIKRDSSQIQVFNEDTGDKEIARRILGLFIDENGLDIKHPVLNTRTIGKKFFEWHNGRSGKGEAVDAK
jgi:hypothetical protein